MVALQNSEDWAYKEIYKVHYVNLVRYCFNLTGNWAQAEDIVQNTIIKIWSDRKHIVIRLSLKSYLHQAVFNNFINESRRLKRQERSFLELKNKLLEHQVDLDGELLEKRRKLLDLAIAELPKKNRQVFLLRKKHGYSYREIASEMDISEKAVEKHLVRALGRIKEFVRAVKNHTLFFTIYMFFPSKS